MIEVSRSLIDDVYSIEDAVDALIQMIDLIEMERQGIISDMRSGYKQREEKGTFCKEYVGVYRF